MIDYKEIARYAFSEDNPGYNPEVQEAPNGDDNWDTKKRYAHIAPKYGFSKDLAFELWNDARDEAQEVADDLDLNFTIGQDSTLRILEYPPGATTAPHTDFDLFTLSIYRSNPKAFHYLDEDDKYLTTPTDSLWELHPGLHYGELLTEFKPELLADKHEVVATDEPQYSIVFFAMPPLNLMLPKGTSVSSWLEERKARSRRLKE